MRNNFDLARKPPQNRLIGAMPKIGIRPTIDGRLGGVRESLEDQTMKYGPNSSRFSVCRTAPRQRSAGRVYNR